MKRIPFFAITCLLLSTTALQSAAGDERWSFLAGDSIFASPAIGPNGGVFIATREGVTADATSTDGDLYALNPDGSLRWRFTGATDWIDGSPSVSPAGIVFAPSWDGSVYALDTASGELLWQFATTGPVVAGAACHQQTVYVASTDGLLYALDAATGAERWVASNPDSFSPLAATPVLSDDGSVLFVGDEAGYCSAFSTTDGSLLWSFSITEADPPDATTGVAVVAPAALDTAGNPYFTCKNGRLYALHGQTGQLRWSFPATEPILSAPAITPDGTVLFASKDGYLYGVDLEGFQLFESFVGDVFYCSPSITTDGEIVIAGYSGSADMGISSTLWGLDASGHVLWDFSFPAYNDASPVMVPDGSLYIADLDGTVYKLEGNAPPPDKPSWPGYLGSRFHSGQRATVLPPTLLDWFPSIRYSEDGWSYLDWLAPGGLRTAPDGLPWLQHQSLGWLAVLQSGTDWAWLYDPAFAQPVYTQSPAQGLFFLADDAHWLQQSTDHPSWFFNYSTAAWVSR